METLLRIRSALLLGCFPVLTMAPPRLEAQARWRFLDTGSDASLRGLSVASDRVIWASGTRGTVLRSVDGGDSWTLYSIPGARDMDLRSIHAHNADTAHVAATAGRIWRTTDGGKTWNLTYQTSDTSVFLDALVFRDNRSGMALGDPRDGRFLILVTQNSGATWSEAPPESCPPADDGEVAFAASGTSLVTRGEAVWLGTGGTQSHIFRSTDGGASWISTGSALRANPGSGGAFSVAFADASHGVAVGGDYTQPDSSRGSGSFTSDGGRTWSPATTQPSGYRSGVAIASLGGQLVALATGTNGTDVSRDGGRTWTPLDGSAFNAVQFSPSGVAFAAGGRGKIARLDAGALFPPKH